jgi:hypothetical protein
MTFILPLAPDAPARAQAWRVTYPHMEFFGAFGVIVRSCAPYESFPMGPHMYSTSGNDNSLRYDLRPHHGAFSLTRQRDRTLDVTVDQ